MDAARARQVFDEQLRRSPRPSPSTLVERTAHAVREVSVGPDGWGAVVWTDLDATTADREIDDQLAYFAALGRSFEWKLYDGDTPDDLADRLRSKGFESEDPEALMIADIDEVDLTAAPPHGVRIEEISAGGDLAGFRRAGTEAFESPPERMAALVRELERRLELEPDLLTVVVAMAGERPLCGARTDFHPGTGFASLWGGGTVPDWRRRGVYRSVVAYRARQARDRGYRYLRVDATPASEPILTRLGFVRAGSTTPFQSPGVTR